MTKRTALVLAATIGSAIVAAGVAAQANLAGFRYGGNALPFVILLTAGVVAMALTARLIAGREPAVARWAVVTAASLWFYLVVTAVAAWYTGLEGHRDPIAKAAVALHLTGHILPVALLQICFLVAIERLTGTRTRRLKPAILLYSIGYAGAQAFTVPAGSPYDDIRPAWHVPGLDLLSWLASVPWMLSVLAGPVIAWRSLPKARGGSRRRALLVAVVSTVPVATIVFCVLSAVLAYALDVLPVSAGEIGLGIAFGLPFLCCSAGLVAALAPADPARVWQLNPMAVTVTLGLSFGTVTVTASAMVGSWLGAGAVLPVVLGTLIVAALLTPVHRRLVRALLLRADPVRARAAELVDPQASDPGQTAEQILRTAGADPTARLILKLPSGTWADLSGVGTDPPKESDPVVTDADGVPIAYLRHDAEADFTGALQEIRGLVDKAVLAAAIDEQAERLAAERARAEDAAAAERRRLERDLHDGVQGRLLALALDLQMAQRDVVDASARLVLTDAAQALATAIDELRALASGEAPELLSRHGLRAALVDLAERMPVPVTVSAPDERFAPQVEAVAYLVVCEGVTNAMKHAAATAIEVDVRREQGHAVVQVTDDGRGGADLRAGTGLRGLSERVGAAGGRLVVSDRRPRGTTLEVSLPCGS